MPDQGDIAVVETDASSPSLDSIVSFSVSPVVTQYEHHVQEKEDTDDVIEDSEPEVRSKILLQHTNPKGIYKNQLDFLI